MSIKPAVLAAALVAACGGPPLLANVPRPNTGVVAGVAAGAAAALTLADPKGAAARQEVKKPEESIRAQRVHEEVPSDVLDRLDEKQKPAATETAAEATAPPAQASDAATGVVSPVPLK